jgi:thioredoxin 1
MGPIFEQVAACNAGKVDFFKLNTDMNPGTPLKYRIMGIPSLLIFKNCQEVQRIVGVSSAETLQRELDKVL